MALSSVKIFTTYDNEPFVRSLTATLRWNPSNDGVTYVPFRVSSNPDLINYPIGWAINTTGANNVRGLIGNNQPYTFGSTGTCEQLNPLIVKFSTNTYPPDTVAYTLYNMTVSAAVGFWDENGPGDTTTLITATNIPYDNYPEISADLLVNYESTSKNNTFYRLTSATAFPVNLKINSVNLPLSTALNDSYYKTSLILNNTVPLPALNSVTSFTTVVPTVCSIYATVSAVSAIGSISRFYTPHIIDLNSISGIFVTSLPIAEFIAYPTFYFANALTQKQLNASNYTTSPGVCFYGEGHTEVINVSARAGAGITNYIWKDITNNLSLSVSNSFTLNTNTITVPTAVGRYPTIPICLQVTNTAVPSTAPSIGYNDIDGTPFYYSYYTSTVDASGNEFLSNTNIKQSIKVVPYDPVSYVFTPGPTDTTVFLPADKSKVKFIGSLQTGFKGAATIQPCFDKYGANWQWSSFEECNTNPSSFSKSPSSWSTTASAGTFPKKWHNECDSTYSNCSAESFNFTPVGCSGSNISWSLSTPSWYLPPNNIGSSFTYLLNFADPFYSNTFTFDNSKVTPFNVTVTESVTCNINAFPNDWQNKVTNIVATSSYNIYGAPVLRLYTPNRYMLTGTKVNFQNIIQNSELLSDLTINYGDDYNYGALYNPNTVVTLTGNDIKNNFSYIYNNAGSKTITLSGNVKYGGTVSRTFKDIVNIVSIYDDVDEGKFITENTPLSLPHTIEPYIAPNDNVVADNINNLISKIYDNLNYLERRGKVYPNTTSETFGWLGVPQPTAAPVVTELTGTTWENFFNTNTTWDILACTNNVPIYVPPPVTNTNTNLGTISIPTYVVTIASSVNNVSLKTELVKLGWNQVIPATVVVNVCAAAIVGSSSIASPALTLEVLPRGSTLKLNNAGTIVGAGGAVGPGGLAGKVGMPGGIGGPALTVSYSCTVNNTGNIYGGGGGGGGGGAYNKAATSTSYKYSCCTFTRYTSYKDGTKGCWAQDTKNCGDCQCIATWSVVGFFDGCANFNLQNVCTGTSTTAEVNTPGQPGGQGAGYNQNANRLESAGTAATGSEGKGGDGGKYGKKGDNGSKGTYEGGIGGEPGKSLIGKIYVNGGTGVILGTVEGIQD